MKHASLYFNQILHLNKHRKSGHNIVCIPTITCVICIEIEICILVYVAYV